MKSVLLLLATLLMSTANAENKQRVQPIVNDEASGKAFFSQFMYRPVYKCGEGKGYFYFASSESFQMPKYDDGDDGKAAITLYLLDSGDYVLDYLEMKIKYYIEHGFGYEPMMKQRFHGKWKITQAGRLELENMGILIPITIFTAPTFNMHLNADIGRQGLRKRGILFSLSSSSVGKDPNDKNCN